MTLSPAARERNRVVLAERGGWPDGALEACDALEQQFPRWSAFWSRGGLPRRPDPGYCATLPNAHPRRPFVLTAPTPEELAELIAQDEQDHPPRPWERR